MDLRRRAPAFALMLCLLAAGAAAPASDTGGGCGTTANKTYTNSSSCHLVFRGLPITIFAEARTTTGTARVHVWATIQELDGSPAILVECEDEGSGYATCGDSVPAQTTQPVDSNLLTSARLACHVEGRGVGTYHCISGSGR